jgi:hypothetical protein
MIWSFVEICFWNFLGAVGLKILKYDQQAQRAAQATAARAAAKQAKLTTV